MQPPRLLLLVALALTALLAATASASAEDPSRYMDTIRDLLYECIGPFGGPHCGPP